MPSSPSLSVLIPTIDEAESLRETVGCIFESLDRDILEVLPIVGERSTDATHDMCQRLRETYGGRIRTVSQTLPRLGGAFRAGISVAEGSRIVLMFADLESDPHVVPEMLAASRTRPGTIVSASRWLRASRFVGYPPAKLVLNFLFQRLCRAVSCSGLTDFTYGFRLYPSPVLKGIDWREVDHGFVLEAILRPVLARVPVLEVPAVWRARHEGCCRPRYRQYARYLPVLFRHMRSTGHRSKVIPRSPVQPEPSR